MTGVCSYGTSVKAVSDVADRQGKTCILDIDAQVSGEAAPHVLTAGKARIFTHSIPSCLLCCGAIFYFPFWKGCPTHSPQPSQPQSFHHLHLSPLTQFPHRPAIFSRNRDPSESCCPCRNGSKWDWICIRELPSTLPICPICLLLSISSWSVRYSYRQTGVPDVIVVNDDLETAYEKFFNACVHRDRRVSDQMPANILDAAPERVSWKKKWYKTTGCPFYLCIRLHYCPFCSRPGHLSWAFPSNEGNIRHGSEPLTMTCEALRLNLSGKLTLKINVGRQTLYFYQGK